MVYWQAIRVATARTSRELAVFILRRRATIAFTSTTAIQRITCRHLVFKITMPAKPKSESKLEPDDGLPIIPFESVTEFETFLEENHSTLPGLHLKFAKKASGIPSITGSEAVEIALCYGWIDGRANSLDENYWLVRYTPRRAKSIWSQKNVGTVARLIEEGRMRESGLKAVEAAKKDGRWERAYAGPATVQVPADLAEKLQRIPAAKAFFEGLNKSERYSVLWRIETASPQARSKRIDALVQMLAAGNVPGAAIRENAVPKPSNAIEGKVGKRNTKTRVKHK